MTKKHQVQHNRPQCIGCTACAAIAPDFWKMSVVDGLADLVDSKKREGGWEELDIDEADYEKYMQCAQSCPVNVIHLIEIGSGKELI
jgi:ferredoxin